MVFWVGCWAFVVWNLLYLVVLMWLMGFEFCVLGLCGLMRCGWCFGFVWVWWVLRFGCCWVFWLFLGVVCGLGLFGLVFID